MVPSCSQLALLGQSWPLDTLSDLGWFLEPFLIGRTAFMPNQRFIVVTEADRDWYSSLVRLFWEKCLFYLRRVGNSCTAPPLTHTVPPSLLALPNTHIATQLCVCVSEVWVRSSEWCKCVCMCLAWRGGLSRARWWFWQLYSGRGKFKKSIPSY